MRLTGANLTFENFRNIVVNKQKVSLSTQALKQVENSYRHIQKAINSQEVHYSINTGFGSLSKVTIPPEQLTQLQENLILSHSCGVGAPNTENVSRGMLLLRLNSLIKGYSGVSLELVEFLTQLLNHKIHPVVPSQGSVGASGDLSPLAHLASIFIKKGSSYAKGKIIASEQALQEAGLTPPSLKPKEGLALINGTQQMTSWGTLTFLNAWDLCLLSHIISGMSLDAIKGSTKPLRPWVHHSRPHKGQLYVSELLTQLLQNSPLQESHKTCSKVQDAYSFRCIPQVHGSSRDLITQASKTLLIEMNAVTDNPLICPETGEVVSNGNFHGQPIAFALDQLTMALCELGSISERRTSKLINPVFSDLPEFLTPNPGINSGLMIPHYTAASLASENKSLAFPGSVDSIPTSNDKEDHVSMGPISAFKADRVCRNLSNILAIELMTACQALTLRKPIKSSSFIENIRHEVQKIVKPLDKDRFMSGEIETLSELILSGTIQKTLDSQDESLLREHYQRLRELPYDHQSTHRESAQMSGMGSRSRLSDAPK